MSDNKRTLVMDTGLDLNKDKHCDLDGYFVDKSGFHKPILRAIKTINQIKGVNQYNDLKMKDNFDVIGSFGPELLNAAYQYSLNQEFVANSSPMLNEYLRNNYPLNNVQKYAVKQLDLLIGKFKLNKQITIYRGISFSNPKYEEVLRLNIGDIYSNNGYTSASYDLRDASAYGLKVIQKYLYFLKFKYL